MRKIPGIISVHDVMPHTLSPVREIIESHLSNFTPAHIQLLVVPGLEWSAADIDQLRAWSAQGYELAGHGWCHEVSAINGLYHHLHSRFISRRAAEHLSQTRAELTALVSRNYQWFEAHQLPAPTLYVPPAWALGRLSIQDVRQAGFHYLETTKGLCQLQTEEWRRLPLSGFEADVRWRKSILNGWNRFNARLAKPDRPLRVSIHPFDLTYHLSDQLREYLSQRIDAVYYPSLFSPAVDEAIEA